MSVVSVDLSGRFTGQVNVIPLHTGNVQHVIKLVAPAGIMVDAKYNAFNDTDNNPLLGMLCPTGKITDRLPVWILEVNLAAMRSIEEYGADLINEILYRVSRAPLIMFKPDSTEPLTFLIHRDKFYNSKRSQALIESTLVIFDQLWATAAQPTTGAFQYIRSGGGLSVTPRTIQLTWMRER